MKLNPRLKILAERVLPRWIIARLDPIQDLIESEVRLVAETLKDGQVVLDAGAGEARHRQYFRRGQYVALDSGSGDSKWDYSRLDICGDLESIPMRSDSVDRILCMVVLEHTRNPGQVLSEFARVLKPEGELVMVVPFLWEEHQAPRDYFRFTQYGIGLLFESSPLHLTLTAPIGGFFRVCARRSVNLLSFFQGGWRWIVFCVLAPFFGLLFPLILYCMDGLDRSRHFSLAYRVRARKAVANRQSSVAGKN
jgi:SAM-dependent methyltransferase